jgi:hypothetical protein
MSDTDCDCDFQATDQSKHLLNGRIFAQIWSPCSGVCFSPTKQSMKFRARGEWNGSVDIFELGFF